MMLNSEFDNRRVVIYARVSTEHEAQLSALGNQLDWYKEILNIHPNWTLIRRYIDEGITGTSAEKRPQFMQMIQDAKNGEFDLILTREVSRFARNTVDTLQYTRMLREHRVEVYFITDGIKTFDGDGELRLTIMATLAQDESRKTSLRVKSGQHTSMVNGVLYGNGNILGYDRVGKELIINPEQAKTVRMIYDMYLDGKGLNYIKDELERQGRLTAMGQRRWFPTSISHILKNSFYCGIIVYRKEYVPDFLKQKKVKNYGDVEQIVVQGTHETIIDIEEFERVQKIMETKRSKCKNLGVGRQKGKRPRTTVWGKLLVCSCGHKFSLRVWDRQNGRRNAAYQCYNSVRTGSYESRKKRGMTLDGICQTPMIPEWKLQMMANEIFRSYLRDRDKVLALANSMLEAHISDTEEKEDSAPLLRQYTQELEALNKKWDNLVDMRAEGDISKDLFRLKCGELEPRMTFLRGEIDRLSQPDEPDEPVENYQEKLTVLQYALEQYTHWDEGEDVPESVIEAFVEKIVASRDGFEWYFRFDGDPNDPLHLSVTGKRKTSAKIAAAGVSTPALHTRFTGCHQGRQELSNFLSQGNII